MSQFDFGTIDPFVTNGEQLAEALNDWRDALHSMHRGTARPSYIVPGMLWVDDSAGATDWQVKVYLGVTPGDKVLFHYNTTAGLVTSGDIGITSNPLLAQAAADPDVAWWNTGNAADAKRWRARTNSAGQLVLSSLTDAGVVQNSFTFNRDGTLDRTVGDFMAYLNSGTGITNSHTIRVFPTVISGNSGSWYNNATGRYTPPAGRYRLMSQASWFSSSAPIGICIEIRKNGVNIMPAEFFTMSGGANLYTQCIADVMASANGTDYFEVFMRASGPTPSGLGNPMTFSSQRLS